MRSPSFHLDDYRRILVAMDCLDAHCRESARMPAPIELAARLGVKLDDLRSSFFRWAGVCPEGFLSYLGPEFPRQLLRKRGGALAAESSADSVGQVRWDTSGSMRKGSAEIACGTLASPFGAMVGFASPEGLCGLAMLDGRKSGAARAASGAGDPIPSESPPPSENSQGEVVLHMKKHWGKARMRHSVADLQSWAGGAETDGLQPRLHMSGTEFQVRVWKALLAIPPGTVATYAAIAERIGATSKGWTRAVGQAVGRNPVAWLIPCHRVIASGGRLQGYRWGLRHKRAMLAWEAVRKDFSVAAVRPPLRTFRR